MAGPLTELGRSVLADSRRWFPHIYAGSDYESACHMALGVAGEAGEVADLIKKLGYGPKARGRGWTEVRADLGAEIADVLTYALGLAALFDLDADEALAAKRAICAERWGDG